VLRNRFRAYFAAAFTSKPSNDSQFKTKDGYDEGRE
jgi:hypothetical protein